MLHLRKRMLGHRSTCAALALRLASSLPSLHENPTSGAGHRNENEVAFDGKLSVMTLPTSSWGPLPLIKHAEVEKRLGFVPRHNLAIPREAFSRYNERHVALDKMIRRISSSSAAVSTGLLSPGQFWVLDEYQYTTEGFRLIAQSQNLFKLLLRNGVSPIMVPETDFSCEDAIHTRNGVRASKMGLRQATNSVLMVSPTAFGFNEQAAVDNKFMNSAKEGNLGEQVLKEFQGLYHVLTEEAGLQVHLFEHSDGHQTPDAVFPNNWFTTHQPREGLGGATQRSMVLYPLKCPNRRRERRHDMVEYLQKFLGYDHVMDLSGVESEGDEFLEGTGVMVLDRVNGTVYVSASERAHVRLAQDWADKMGYNEVVSFRSTDGNGSPVYHTNVMMSIGTDVAIVCSESIEKEADRKNVLAKLSRWHNVIEITRAQMAAFCGNILEVIDGRGLPVMAMSTQAAHAFNLDQKKLMLRNVAGLIHAPMDTIERVGGGGVRCTLAELF